MKWTGDRFHHLKQQAKYEQVKPDLHQKRISSRIFSAVSLLRVGIEIALCHCNCLAEDNGD